MPVLDRTSRLAPAACPRTFFAGGFWSMVIYGSNATFLLPPVVKFTARKAAFEPSAVLVRPQSAGQYFNIPPLGKIFASLKKTSPAKRCTPLNPPTQKTFFHPRKKYFKALNLIWMTVNFHQSLYMILLRFNRSAII